MFLKLSINDFFIRPEIIYSKIKRKTSQDITVTSIARLIPSKGHKYFIEVAKELLKINSKFQFLIVGDTFQGYESYEEKLKTLVVENNLHEKIHFLGLRSDVESILSKSDLVFQYLMSSTFHH